MTTTTTAVMNIIEIPDSPPSSVASPRPRPHQQQPPPLPVVAIVKDGVASRNHCMAQQEQQQQRRRRLLRPIIQCNNNNRRDGMDMVIDLTQPPPPLLSLPQSMTPSPTIPSQQLLLPPLQQVTMESVVSTAATDTRTPYQSPLAMMPSQQQQSSLLSTTKYIRSNPYHHKNESTQLLSVGKKRPIDSIGIIATATATTDNSSSTSEITRTLNNNNTTAGTNINQKTSTKFIGGAEAARQKARHSVFQSWHKNDAGKTKNKRVTQASSKGATRIVRPGETIQSNGDNQNKQPVTQHKKQERYQQYRNQFERFFHTILHWPIHEYLLAAKADALTNNQYQNTTTGAGTRNSNTTTSSSMHLWDKMCRCLHLDTTPPQISDHSSQTATTTTATIQSKYDDITSHCNVRTAVLLEEVRNTICDAIYKITQQWNRTNHSNNSRYVYNRNLNSNNNIIEMNVAVVATEPCGSNNNKGWNRPNTKQEVKNEPNYKMMVKSEKAFTPRQLFNIRPGSIVLIRIGHVPSQLCADDTATTILGVITTGNREMVEKSYKFETMIFNCDGFLSQIGIGTTTMITVTYVTQLVTEFRCYEALNTNYTIHFQEHLLGYPERLQIPSSPTHTRFHDADDDPVVHVPSTNAVAHCDTQSDDNEYFDIPKLNLTQNNAATQFLQSPPNTITLVQGPPGTGKTTLLVSVLCRYLLQSVSVTTDDNGVSISTCGRRIMVCAPTNKAVYVLASRFMRAIRQQTSDQKTMFNVILVGDADKIFMDDRGGSSTSDRNTGNPYKNGTASNHVPLSKEQVALKSIFLYTWIPSVIEGYKRILNFTEGSRTETQSTLMELSKRLRRRINKNLALLPPEFEERMTNIETLLTRGKDLISLKKNLLQHIYKLKTTPTDVVWEQLLRNADVIFCTLASAGGAIVKKTPSIDDLIVDEAAAATEPELYIPFHLQPKRLLAVGDPLQLPATVLSRRAISLGYAKSLHERLMYDCKYDHIMLDVQYRMNPEISSFPSYSFYNNMIRNGDNVMGSNYTNGAVLLNQKPYSFLQVEGREKQSMGGSYYNEAEATAIVGLIQRLKEIADEQPSTNNRQWCSSDRVRVITFYQAQVSHIQQCLEKAGLEKTVVVATVDSSQGCEADVVIISFVRSQETSTDECDASRTLTAGFLTDNRRMNVALTRAKYQLICVANVRQFDQIPNAETLHRLSKNADERGILNDKHSTEMYRQPTKKYRHNFSYTIPKDW